MCPLWNSERREVCDHPVSYRGDVSGRAESHPFKNFTRFPILSLSPHSFPIRSIFLLHMDMHLNMWLEYFTQIIPIWEYYEVFFRKKVPPPPRRYITQVLQLHY